MGKLVKNMFYIVLKIKIKKKNTFFGSPTTIKYTLNKKKLHVVASSMERQAKSC